MALTFWPRSNSLLCLLSICEHFSGLSKLQLIIWFDFERFCYRSLIENLDCFFWCFGAWNTAQAFRISALNRYGTGRTQLPGQRTRSELDLSGQTKQPRLLKIKKIVFIPLDSSLDYRDGRYAPKCYLVTSKHSVLFTKHEFVALTIRQNQYWHIVHIQNVLINYTLMDFINN